MIYLVFLERCPRSCAQPVIGQQPGKTNGVFTLTRILQLSCIWLACLLSELSFVTCLAGMFVRHVRNIDSRFINSNAWIYRVSESVVVTILLSYNNNLATTILKTLQLTLRAWAAWLPAIHACGACCMMAGRPVKRHGAMTEYDRKSNWSPIYLYDISHTIQCS